MKRRPFQIVLGATAILLLGGCDQPVQPPEVGTEDRPQTGLETSQGARQASSPGEMKKRQADFLNRIRSADPDNRTIERAILNEKNELGLILDRSVQLDDIPKLMRSMLTQMAKEFPNQDLTIIAYTPSNPPRKIGTARLDARSRDMTYTPEA